MDRSEAKIFLDGQVRDLLNQAFSVPGVDSLDRADIEQVGFSMRESLRHAVQHQQSIVGTEAYRLRLKEAKRERKDLRKLDKEESDTFRRLMRA